VPDPGYGELVVANAATLLRRNGTDPAYAERPAVLAGELTWTHAELWRRSRQWAHCLERRRPADPATPFHVGVLLDNVPDYVALLAAAGITGAALVGLNPTRRGEQLARDIAHTDLVAVITERQHAPLLDGLPGLPGAPVLLNDAGLAAEPPPYDDPVRDPNVATSWCLIFTSGTSAAPKAVVCSQRRLLVTGERLRLVLGVEADDVGYLSMPLFHSNSIMVGLLPALLAGAAVALRRRFSASGFLADLRRYGVTYWNYTGKPLAYILATPRQPDDADNPLRRAYGNEGSDQVVARFRARFGVEVIDAFGPTEGAIGIVRGPDDPAGSLGHRGERVRVVDESGAECPPAIFDGDGRLANAGECVGELVNVSGVGAFEGYYNNPEATERATRGGWYWSGDLGYADADGYVYFAGRAADWLRVDGENFPAAPIEAAVARHPDVVAAAVYGVPDADAGDQVMAAVVLGPDAVFDPAVFATFVDSQPDLGPKWRPRYVRVAAELPRTPTNKVLHRVLQRQKFRLDHAGADSLWVRGRGQASYRPFTAADEKALREAFDANGRLRFWDL
jgi:fatty-acyl-CoA synthase